MPRYWKGHKLSDSTILAAFKKKRAIKQRYQCPKGHGGMYQPSSSIPIVECKTCGLRIPMSSVKDPAKGKPQEAPVSTEAKGKPQEAPVKPSKEEVDAALTPDNYDPKKAQDLMQALRVGQGIEALLSQLPAPFLLIQDGDRIGIHHGVSRGALGVAVHSFNYDPFPVPLPETLPAAPVSNDGQEEAKGEPEEAPVSNDGQEEAKGEPQEAPVSNDGQEEAKGEPPAGAVVMNICATLPEISRSVAWSGNRKNQAKKSDVVSAALKIWTERKGHHIWTCHPTKKDGKPWTIEVWGGPGTLRVGDIWFQLTE